MKKYLGSGINMFGAIVLLLIALASALLGLVALKAGTSQASIAVAVFSAVSFAVLVCYLILNLNQLFSWGHFKADCVEVFVPFKKKYVIEYTKCVDVGIAWYFHSVQKSSFGSVYSYIYLSYTAIDRKHRTNINLVKSSKTFVKLKLTEDTYEYLLTVLPKRQKRMLSDSKSRFEQECK